jgi:gamma-glutamyltranspeptidase/glutathione hydrolase
MSPNNRRPPGPDPGRETSRQAVSPWGMAATARDLATDAAARVLETGGNAFDAAVAAAFALAVCEPSASGLGGQTVLTVYQAAEDRVFVLDGTSRPPARAYLLRPNPEERFNGHRASTVPTTPAVLEYVRRRLGSRPLAELIAPAAALAEEGFPVSRLQATLIQQWRHRLRAGPGGDVFLTDGAFPPAPGTVIRQPALAATLTRLAGQGIEDFYQGEIARLICRDMADHGGLIQASDLAPIPWPDSKAPVAGRFGGLEVVSDGPPGAGEALLTMLGQLGFASGDPCDLDSPAGAVRLAETIRQCLLTRDDLPSDRRRAITGGHTTHLSIMDASGNAASLTQSLERVYGSRTMSPTLGFFYNNYMGSFEYDDENHPRFLRPGVLPWSQVAPTVVFRNKKPWLVIGSPGGSRIAPAMVQVMLRLMTLPPLEAVSAPRLHCSVEGRVALEAARMDPRVPAELRRRGFRILVREPYSFYLGCVQLVLREGDEFIGVADPRRDGSARGPDRAPAGPGLRPAGTTPPGPDGPPPGVS